MSSATAIPLAIAEFGGVVILLAFLVIGLLAISYGLYTRRGSMINQHPYGDIDHNSGPETPSQLTHDVTQDIRNWDRGTAGHHRRHDAGA